MDSTRLRSYLKLGFMRCIAGTPRSDLVSFFSTTLYRNSEDIEAAGCFLPTRITTYYAYEHRKTDCTTMDASDEPPQTFGIELELICLRPAILPHSLTAFNIDSVDMVDVVYNALVRRSVPVSNHNSLCINDGLPPFSQWRVEEEVLDLTPEEQALLPAGYIAEPLELASRKFFYARDDWRTEITTVLNALKELEAHGVKFITNRSTGFHVHVGYDHYTVPLRTAKNLFLFATAYEHVLDELHAAPRIAIPWEKQERHHCYPLSFFAKRRDHGRELFERLRYIERAQTYEQLGSTFFASTDEMGTGEQCTGHNSAYNFDNLYPDEERGRYAETLTGTIEFRQHAGTLDFTAITSWIEVTVGLVRFAAESASNTDEMENFVNLLFNAVHPNQPHKGLWTDLGVADMPEEVYEYYNALKNGTLIIPAPEITDKHLPLLPLLTANWTANVADSSRQAVQDTIRHKSDEGLYGHDYASVGFVVPNGSATSLLDTKKHEAMFPGGQSWSEADFSLVMEWMFDYVSKRHQDAIAAVAAVE